MGLAINGTTSHPDCLHCPWLAQPGAPRRSHSLQSYLGISRQPSSSRRSHQCSGACVHMMSNLFLSLPNDTYYLLRMVYTIDIRINRWCFHHLLSCFFLMITLANTVPFCSPSNNKPIRCNFVVRRFADALRVAVVPAAAALSVLYCDPNSKKRLTSDERSEVRPPRRL
jgi:hypothetical protein